MEFKNEKDRKLFSMLSPVLVMIYADLNYYAKSKHNIDLVVTATISTKEEDKLLGRSSSSHMQMRALDIRTNDIDTLIVKDIVNYINSKKDYYKYHYISNKGVTRLAYYHFGSEEHIHLSIHSKFRII